MGGGGTAPAFSGLHVYLQFTVKWVFPLSCGIFLFLPLLQAFPLLIAGRVLLLLPSLAGLFIYCSVRDFPPHFSAQGAPPSLLCVFSIVIVYYSVWFFLFSLGGRSVCPGRSADLAQGCLWEYGMLLSSPGGLLLPSRSGAGVQRDESPPGSLFNVKWRCYVQAGGVEESKFCLFLVVFPARCISSISPRFYFRRHTFCSLPLVTILESVSSCLGLDKGSLYNARIYYILFP
jgi:hypothetical protein